MEKREPGNEFFKAVADIQKIMKNHSITMPDLNAALSSEIIIPVSIFKSGHTPLGALTVYLKTKGFGYKEIGKLLNRDHRTIWLTYKNSINKKHIIAEDFQLIVPIRIFSDRNLSIMESLVRTLKDSKGMRLVDIAKIIGKDQRTVWSFNNRAMKKCR